MKKNNIKIILAIIGLLLIIFSVSYAYYTSYNNAKSNYNTLIADSLNINFTLNATVDLDLYIDPAKPINNNVIAINSITDNVSLINNSDYKLTCNYEIYYAIDTYTGYSALSAGDIILTGSDSSNENNDFSYDLSTQSSGEYKLTDATITVNSNSSLNQSWTFTMTHYNLDKDQTALLGTSFKGHIYFKAGSCSENTGPTLIAFTIDGHTLYAEEGMTWEEWAESEYNTTNLLYSSEGCLYTQPSNDSSSSITFVNNMVYNSKKIKAIQLLVPYLNIYCWNSVLYGSGPFENLSLSSDFNCNQGKPTVICPAHSGGQN